MTSALPFALKRTGWARGRGFSGFGRGFWAEAAQAQSQLLLSKPSSLWKDLSGSLGQSPAPPPPLPRLAGNANLCSGSSPAPLARNPSLSWSLCHPRAAKGFGRWLLHPGTLLSASSPLAPPMSRLTEAQVCFPQRSPGCPFPPPRNPGRELPEALGGPVLPRFCHGCGWQLCPWKTSRLRLCSCIFPPAACCRFQRFQPLLNIFYFQEHCCYFRSLFLSVKSCAFEHFESKLCATLGQTGRKPSLPGPPRVCFSVKNRHK